MAAGPYLRPTGFVEAPFGHDGKVARLAGGMCWFSAVEILRRGAEPELLAVSDIEAFLSSCPEAEPVWSNLIGTRPPLSCSGRAFRFDQPQIMGILNVTPDSFSDGGAYEDVTAAAEAGWDMSAAGAALIDIGGESTRPGAEPVWEGDEAARILPVVERLRDQGALISIDTRKAAVMRAALTAGAHLVNDVSALTYDSESAGVVAEAGVPVVLMHAQGDPQTMQQAPAYDHVLLDVYDWLAERIDAAVAAGIERGRIIVDPGIGFGKTLRHNLALINGLSLFHGLGAPLLLGASRKRFIGALSKEAPADRRLAGSLTVLQAGLSQGVQLVRVHDVPESVQALHVWRGLRDAALSPA
ncbi:dihydropteroate synthase [Pacificimonas flava]|uniref:Dihydropteroate synthase n=2 Tax=Pacificimonas TaxID=1960290 RepID=A0A219B216_9SPHN|nr:MULTISPECIES: dihydropteroate synthase [Pacificimonas]MBZ6378118.1 dihydropteroate synthase [Pacificimonas aurantium]OWV32244.1 dihydropteroate synthase [Pacificimonas flava]